MKVEEELVPTALKKNPIWEAFVQGVCAQTTLPTYEQL
jgi:hypothetical protein